MAGKGGRLSSLGASEAARALKAHWAPLSPADLKRTCTWLLSLKPHSRRLWARNRRGAAHPQVVRRLIRVSYALRLKDPGEALRVAQAAVETAEALDTVQSCAQLLSDLRAAGWGNLANALRLVDDVTGAEAAWTQADALAETGTGNPALAADLRRQKGTLRCHQRRFRDAAVLQEEAAHFAERAGDLHGAGKTRLDLAITHFYAGDVKQALSVVFRAAQHIDCRREPELGLVLMHNTLLFLEADCQYSFALRLVDRIELWYREPDSELLGHRASWLRGRLHMALGHYKTATHYFEKARRGFLAAGQVYDAALTGFDLALAWMNVGAFYRVERLAQEMYSVFTAKEIPREAAATLIVFADAARQQRLGLALMRRLAAQLAPLRRPGAQATADPEPG